MPAARREILTKRAITQVKDINISFEVSIKIRKLIHNALCKFIDHNIDMSDLEKINLSDLDGINPALTRYARQEPAPVLPLREEPDLLSWLETSGRLVSDQDSNDQEISTVEEEELSALMGEKEDYKAEEESSDEEWED